MENNGPAPDMPATPPMTAASLPRQKALSTVTVLLPIDDMAVLTELVTQIRQLVSTIPGSMVDTRCRSMA